MPCREMGAWLARIIVSGSDIGFVRAFCETVMGLRRTRESAGFAQPWREHLAVLRDTKGHLVCLAPPAKVPR